MAKYVQYGCGLCAPSQWINYDASPTLRIQKIPVIGKLLRSRLNVTFPSNVRYGDIIKGLPEEDDSCDGVFCSHTLEHLSLHDFRKALKNTYRIIRKGGVFRCVVPDLESGARKYLSALENNDKAASIAFIGGTLLGVKERQRGLKGVITQMLSNAHHLWMWDHASMAEELRQAGFIDIRHCSFNDSLDQMFSLVEDEDRFREAVAIECRK